MAVSSKLKVYSTQIFLRITVSPVSSIQEGATANTLARRTSRGEEGGKKSKDLKFDVLPTI